MGNRTLSPGLVLRALFLDSEAYAEFRDDDNPFIEGLFLLVIIGVLTALLAMIGQLLAWASTPNLARSKTSSFATCNRCPGGRCRRERPASPRSFGVGTTWVGR